MTYDKDYYECGIESGKSLYNNYRWMPELTIPFCSRIVEHLKISTEQKVLDFGCAKGYSVKAMRLLGRQGVLISAIMLFHPLQPTLENLFLAIKNILKILILIGL